MKVRICRGREGWSFELDVDRFVVLYLLGGGAVLAVLGSLGAVVV